MFEDRLFHSVILWVAKNAKYTHFKTIKIKMRSQ